MKFNKLNNTESSEYWKSTRGEIADMPVPRLVLVSCLSSMGNTMTAYLHTSNTGDSE